MLLTFLHMSAATIPLHCRFTCNGNSSFQSLADQNMDIMYDYEILPTRKPKFLAQTAAHVSGAAYLYQRKDVHQDSWGEKVSKLGTAREVFSLRTDGSFLISSIQEDQVCFTDYVPDFLFHSTCIIIKLTYYTLCIHTNSVV